MHKVTRPIAGRLCNVTDMDFSSYNIRYSWVRINRGGLYYYILITPDINLTFG